MKKLVAVIFSALAVAFLQLPSLSCQTETDEVDDTDFFSDEMDDLDSMFADAEDTEGVESAVAPQINNTSSSNNSINLLEFYGNVNASLGILDELWPTPTLLPYAAF